MLIESCGIKEISSGSSISQTNLCPFSSFLHSDRPSPPSSVTLELDREIAKNRTPDTYGYHFLIHPPTTFSLSQSYAAEMIAFRSGDSYYYNCSCVLSQDIGPDNVGTGEFLANEVIGYQLYFQAAVLNSDGQRSDYLPYYHNSKTVCGTIVEQGEQSFTCVKLYD